MDNRNPYPSDTAAHAAHSSTSSINLSSPTTPMFSKGPSSRGSNSSIASSPGPRESFDMYGGAQRLENVTEDPQERDEFEGYTLVNDRTYDFNDYDKAFAHPHGQTSPLSSPVQHGWSFGETDEWSLTSPGPRYFTRRKSMDQPSSTNNRCFSSKFGSISRRWRNRSAAGPQLSIITHINSPASRTRSLSSSQILSPALSAISKYESLLLAPSVAPTPSEVSFDTESRPIDMRTKPSEEEEMVHATTPLLPPMLSELGEAEEPVQSPLQSPSIAPTSALMSSRTSSDTPVSCLPSPPLSARPSMVSMHTRSRTNTMTNSPFADIPPMQLLDDSSDPWAVRLGHANFTIHPKPYTPETVDLDSYTEFRNNWDQARTNYAKHITRTAEHYGLTSKVYKLTEEKWASVDHVWKKQHTRMRTALAPVLVRLSDGDSEMHESATSSTVLEKPLTKVVLPIIDDKSGKFPELGDGEIVGPMAVARPRTLTNPNKGMEPRNLPLSPRKRNLLKFLSGIFRS
ncbi:uncharacterized protein Z518_05630 [Rhinocladiella mackenziei CBS 650.93]|uniref:Only prolin and serin are matching in the corresponding protein n=1 Tax=Rhinocladiella mackenziei CBS 650.93 TaxID=1442369 RepID=A0A0D2J6S1_9EURO|nr:uncharacterized protein Z518_05630 [Rhinocladiella mackenziei CBS 650.93]KIX04760.1 hypothetical protein Z518_05630 [Rhinocladiella mackenziei CBS 650.93]